MMNPDAAAKPNGAPTRKVIPPPPSASLRPPPPPPDQPPLKCPRCDSPNTKFCYYNNYSLSQPRHFCKTCRRYWTKGGALRNVPVGGGCRKNKKSRPSSSSSTSSAAAASSSKALQGLSMPPPTMDFSRGLLNQFISFGDLSGGGGGGGGGASVFNGGPIGVHETSGGGGGSMSVTASIETLSSMNQDLHWKLQQQRLAMLFGGGGGGMNHQHVENSAAPVVMTYPMAAERGRGEWVFEGGASSYGGGVGVGGSNGGGINSSNSSSSNNNNSNNWGSIQSWSDLHHFTALP